MKANRDVQTEIGFDFAPIHLERSGIQANLAECHDSDLATLSWGAPREWIEEGAMECFCPSVSTDNLFTNLRVKAD